MLNSKYEKILPTNTYLSDSVILTQAWKKSQQYIRSTNWYADNFELDISTINLEDNLHYWKKNLTESSIYLDPLQLVPAPKASHWIFDNAKWMPEDPQALQMRPLAHINIKDQTYFTALLICIANTVETKQGDTECPLSDVHKNHIVNYGNRLYCSYSDTQAKFLWGNSKIYREYFNDYQTFLQRPTYFAKQAYLTKSKDEEIFIIHLDVRRFYDTIDREKLINKIQAHIYKNDNSETSYLDNLLRSFQEWTWTPKSKILYKKTCRKDKESVPKGIPQGLVAGGFLANIYLLEFDEELSYEIGKSQDSYQILDYCRYVDDMRLVVSIKNTLDMITLKSKIITYISSKLECINLQLNDDKTEIQKYTPKINNISNSINKIKNSISGPMSQNEVDDNINQLESILTLASTKNNNSDKSQTTNPLELIETSNHDIREDTLLRFSANNLHKLLKQKRSFYAQQVDQNNNIIAGDWDFLQERIARRFISCWSKDPSLVVLLKKGLELFPDIKLLKPIIQELLTGEKISEKQKYIYEYCLYEIFRHSATILHNKSIWAFPAHAQIDTFFEYLQTIAANIINSDTKNKYLKHQVMFYMLTKNNSIPTSKAKEDRRIQHILKIITGDCDHSLKMTKTEFLENLLLAYKFTLQPKVTIRTINLLIENYYTKQILINELTEILKKLAIQSPELFTLIVKHAKSLKLKWLSLHAVQILIDQMLIYDQPIKGILEPNHDLPLFSILKRSDNPFAHENAILKLLCIILSEKKFSFNEQLDISKIKIRCANWAEAQDFKTQFIISSPLTANKDPIYKAPSWLTNEHKPLYNIGIFIRTCLLGKLDWSTSNALYNKNSENISLKTSYYKRQLGMMHSPESICGQNAALSSWLSELLYYLLQWPGISLSNNPFKAIANINHLLKSIEQRCIYQKNMYCELSRIPGYVETIDLKWDNLKKSLSVIMVQSLLPRKNDFTSHGLTLSTPSYRAKHRRHIAAVSELILKTIICQNSDNSAQQNQIDLIVWPELSVHIDDTDILKRLSDKTGAIIFAGLNFITQTNISGPNNVAKWIIPNKFHGNRTFIERLQGKYHITQDEQQGGIMSWRPYQLFIELKHPSFPNHRGFMLTGSICYDATDIKLSADLKTKSDAYIVSALNQDTTTFDTMIDALHYHMYQHVVLVNGGEFGGSVAKAPYKERYDKLITHTHGKNQINISRFEMNMFDFRNITNNFHSGKKSKTKPAGA